MGRIDRDFVGYIGHTTRSERPELRVMKIQVVLIFLLSCTRLAGQDSGILAGRNVFDKTDSILTIAKAKWARDSAAVMAWSDTLSTRIRSWFAQDSVVLALYCGRANFSKQRLDSAYHRLANQRDSLFGRMYARRDVILNQLNDRWSAWKVAATKGSVPSEAIEELTMRMNGLRTEFELPDLPDFPELPDLDFKIELDDGLHDLVNMDHSMTVSDLTGTEVLTDPLMSREASLLEQGVLQNENLAKVTDYLGEGEKLSSQFVDGVGAIQDPALIRERLKTEVMSRAIDHFQGKEEVLKLAMDRISMLKAKYGQVSSLADLKALPRNPMFGKSLRERLETGLTFQFLRSGVFQTKVNPYIRYHATGRLSFGLGWMIRYEVDGPKYHLEPMDFGVQVFGECNLGHGASVYLESTAIHATGRVRSYVDGANRDWSLVSQFGIRKRYRIYRSVKGTMLILMPVSPMAIRMDRLKLTTRFGFEVPLPKKKTIPVSN